MRAQLSLELMAYAALAAISMAASVGIYAKYSSSILSGVAKYETYEFVQSINGAALSGAIGEQFSAFVPSGICNSSQDGSTLYTPYGAFYLVENISIDREIICPGGMTERLSLVESGSAIRLEEG